jgi:hypothetical protein
MFQLWQCCAAYVVFILLQHIIMNPLWVIIWILVLWFLAWPIGFFAAGWYVCLSPFEVCIEPLKDVNEFLMRGVKLPFEVAKRLKEGKQGW